MLKHKQLKILYIHHDALLTGSLVSLNNMLSALDKNLFQPIVVLPTDGPAKDFLITAGYTVHVRSFFPFFTTPGPRCLSRDNAKQLTALIPNFRLRAFIKKINPDIIHLNDKATLSAGISCIGLKIPIVQHSRSAFHITACTFNKWICQTLIKLYAKHIICISEDEQQGFESINNKSIIFNTVNKALSKEAIKKRISTRESFSIKADDFVIGIAENLGVYKGLFEVINLAGEILSKNYPIKVKFMLVGKIAENDNLSRYGFNLSSKAYVDDFIKKNNYEDRIIVTGYRKDALDLIAAMDTIVIAKAHGVLGRQPIEAQSVGVPVVAINGHSKKSTVVKHEITGYLVNDYSGLSLAIEKLIDNKTNKQLMSEAGIKYADEQFNPITNTSKIQHIYHQLLQ